MDEQFKVNKLFGGNDYEVTDDNLRSNDTVEIVLGISEGPIAGLVDGEKSFFLDNTKLEGNFKNYYFEFYDGSQPAPVIKSKLGGFASSIIVGQPLYTNIPVVRTTTKTNISALEIRLNISALYKKRSTGVFNQEFEFTLEYKRTSSSEWLPVYSEPNVIIKGKTSSGYIKEYRWEVDKVNDTYDIRINRIRPADDNPDHVASVTWESIQEVIADEYTFPGLACVHFSAKANKRFTKLPDFSGIYRGRIVKIPSNFDAQTRTYAGLWDGTFKLGWTDDPAWVLYDLITNETYGLSSYHPLSMDKWEVYEASKWTSEKVPDGKGGYHPRFSFNILLSSRMSAKELARYVAGSFNATFYDNNNGEVSLRVDKPEEAVALFTKQNIIDGLFEYSFTDLTTRYNDIIVSFINPELDWQEDKLRIFDQTLIDKFGRIPYEFVAVGCTNRQQAARMAKYKLVTANTERCIVTFKTNRLAHNVFPRDVILISDPEMGYAISGRILSVDNDNPKILNLRDPIYLEIGVDYKLSFDTPDGIIKLDLDPTSPVGNVSKLILKDPAPSSIQEFAVFSLEQANGGYGLPKPFWVLKVAETDNPDINTITAIELNRDKWNIVDNMLDEITEPKYSYLGPNTVEPPSNGQAELVYLEYNGFQTLSLKLSFQRSPTKLVDKYEIYYSRNEDPDVFYTTTADTEIIIPNIASGQYIFNVYAVNSTGKKSAPLMIEYTVGEEARLIQPVKNLREKFYGTNEFHTPDLTITWDPSDDPHFFRYILKIYDNNNTLVRTEYLTTNEYVYPYNLNRSELNSRSIWVSITVEDIAHNLSSPVNVTFVNFAPPPPSNFKVTATLTGWNIEFDKDENILDLVGFRIYSSTNPNFTPDESTLIYSGPDNTFFYPGNGGRYFKIAAVDTFGTSLVYSGEIFSSTTGTLPNNSVDTNNLVTDAILKITTSTVSDFNQSSNNASLSNTINIGTVTTDSVTDGKIILMLAVTGAKDFIAKSKASSTVNGTARAKLIIKRNTGQIVWQEDNEKTSTTLLEIMTPPVLILYDNVPKNSTITYVLELYAYHDKPDNRSLQHTVNPFKAILFEGRR